MASLDHTADLPGLVLRFHYADPPQVHPATAFLRACPDATVMRVICEVCGEEWLVPITLGDCRSGEYLQCPACGATTLYEIASPKQ